MIPSPITWLTVPSYRCTASIMCVEHGSRSLPASSGSRSASSSIEPFRSAKRTVTCLRSPSSAAREVRIFSARCFGVYDSGAGEAACWLGGERGAARPAELLAPCDGGATARAGPLEPGATVLAEMRARVVLSLAPGAGHAGASEQRRSRSERLAENSCPGLAWSRIAPRVVASPRVSSVAGGFGGLIHTASGRAGGYLGTLGTLATVRRTRRRAFSS